MARLSDLPIEIQEDIWTLVLPHQGGVHWVEFEGVPHSPNLVKEAVERVRDVFNDREPTESEVVRAAPTRDYLYYLQNTDHSSPFFRYLYPIVPSVWGRSRGPAPLSEKDVLTQELQDEIAKTRSCRQLSTYTQVTTLLSTCRISRLTALHYLYKMLPDQTWPIYRGAGPACRPRPYSVWRQQYRNIETPPEWIWGDVLVPKIWATFDLVVFRLHTASGYPTPILNHSFYQLRPRDLDDAPIMQQFDRIGIEWHPLWATPEGRKEFCDEAVSNIMKLTGKRNRSSQQLYWLVDGVPRPQWDQYPPAIPAAFSRVIERRKSHIFKFRPMDQPWNVAWNAWLLEYYGLDQEFEANGRRYYVVFVVTHWRPEYDIEESFLDPALNWDGPFPGGEDLWPEALRDPVRLAYEVCADIGTDRHCTYVLSWEPI